MKAATSNFSNALNFFAKAGLALAVAPLLPVIGLMWLVATIQKPELFSNGKSQIKKKSRQSTSHQNTEPSNPALDITWTGDSLLNGY